MTDFTYVGTELQLFEGARHWKRYFASRIRPFIGKEVLEVGAGNGATTAVLCDGSQRRWTCLEPDASLARQIQARIDAGQLPQCCRAEIGMLGSFSPDQAPDTILYIDVLEHIEDDAAELRNAAATLAKSGHVIAVSPAHQWLFSPFDAHIGHFRRYSRARLISAGGRDLTLVWAGYLDSVGILASLANAVLLRRRMPNARQVELWDRLLVPLSRRLDPLFLDRLGKSVIAIWKRA